MGSLRARKGISEIIASLLIICITVSAGTLLAAYASGLMGKIQPPTASQPYTEQLSAEYYNWQWTQTNQLTVLSVTLRNTGVATINLGTAVYYISGVKLASSTVGAGGTTVTCTSGTWSSVAPNVACTIPLSGLGTTNAITITSGVQYVLKIVLTTDGATLTFALVAGSTTH